MLPAKSAKRHEPRVFGFKVHAAASLARWQDGELKEMNERLWKVGVPNGFVEEDEDEELEDEELVD
jgi:casein kinase II subunit beta